MTIERQTPGSLSRAFLFLRKMFIRSRIADAFQLVMRTPFVENMLQPGVISQERLDAGTPCARYYGSRRRRGAPKL